MTVNIPKLLHVILKEGDRSGMNCKDPLVFMKQIFEAFSRPVEGRGWKVMMFILFFFGPRSEKNQWVSRQQRYFSKVRFQKLPCAHL